MSRAPEQSEEVRAGPVKTVIYASVYISTSVALISFNKYLMHAGRFPHPVALTTLHMIAAWVCLFTLYCFKPSLFPAMEHAKAGPKCLGVVCDFGIYFIPLGLFFAVAITCSNYAYFYCAVPFLQFMKEGNIVLIFLFSVVAGLQSVTRARVLVLTVILIGATMSVTGEIKFVLVGFLLQALSQLGECSKNVLGEWMMTSSQTRLDPLTYTMSTAPVALVPLAIATFASSQSTMITAFLHHWPLLLANCLIAVALNVMIAILIQSCSAMAGTLCGLLKDILVVTVAAAAFGVAVTGQQVVGFALCILGIGAWSSIRFRPDLWNFLDGAEKIPLMESAISKPARSEP